MADVQAALRHYESLGFRTRSHEDGSGYGFVERDEVALHVTYRRTSYDGRTEAPADMPWNMREGIHHGPDRNIIRFGSPLN